VSAHKIEFGILPTIGQGILQEMPRRNFIRNSGVSYTERGASASAAMGKVLDQRWLVTILYLVC
jgi:hypothetical protein